MPAPARALHAEGLAAFLDVRDDEDLGMAGQVVLQRLHDMQRPEAAREGDLLLGRHAHLAKDEDAVAGPPPPPPPPTRGGRRPRGGGGADPGAKTPPGPAGLRAPLPRDFCAWVSTPP